MAVGAGKYWFNGLPVDGLSSTAGAGKYWVNGLPYDTLAAAAAPSGVTGTVNVTQASDTVSTAGTVLVHGSASVTQADDTVSATSGSGIIATASIIQGGDVVTASAVVAGAIAGSADLTEAGQTVSGAGSVVVRGAAETTQAGDVANVVAAAAVAGQLSSTQDEQIVTAVVEIGKNLVSSLVQQGNTVAATAGVVVSASANITQANNAAPPAEPFVVAPSYGTWAKRQNKSKPQAPQLPPPVEAGEIVIDEAVLRQMEEERLAALARQKKAEALDRVEELRAYEPAEKRPTRSVTIDPRRFDVVEATPEIRTKVVSLFREQPKPALVEPVRGSITLRALGPRHLPEPEIRKARTISLRRSPNRMMQTGL